MEKLQQLLDKMIRMEKADKGNIQVYNATDDCLRIVTQIGFEESFLKHFGSVKPFDSSSCGRAFGIGSTVLISDVATDIAFRNNVDIALTAGFRAVKSVPIFSTLDKCIGIVSTHFKEPKWNWKTNDLLNILPEIAIELERMIDRKN